MRPICFPHASLTDRGRCKYPPIELDKHCENAPFHIAWLHSDCMWLSFHVVLGMLASQENHKMLSLALCCCALLCSAVQRC